MSCAAIRQAVRSGAVRLQLSLHRRALARSTRLVGLALVTSLAFGPAASSATVAAAWQAKIGAGGANGTATIQVLATGTGTLTLKLARMKPSTSMPVVIHAGTCGSPGATVLTLPSIKTTSRGAASRVSSLTATHASAISAAASTGKIAIRIGAGTARKCGLLAAQVIPAYVAATIGVGEGPFDVTVSPSGVWVTNFQDLTVSRIDPATNGVLQTIKVGTLTLSETTLDVTTPAAISYGEGSLWVTLLGFHLDLTTQPPTSTMTAGAVVRLDPASGAVQATIPVGKGAYDVEATTGAVWVAMTEEGMIVRIDPATNMQVATVPAPDPTGVAAGPTVVWVACQCGTVSRVDPATNSIVATINTQVSGSGIAMGGGAVWATHPGHKDQADGSVSRIDPLTNAVVANTVVGEGPFAIAVTAGNVWVGLYGAPTVVRLSAATGSIVARITVSDVVNALAATDHAVWAVHEGTSKVTRINY